MVHMIVLFLSHTQGFQIFGNLHLQNDIVWAPL